MIAVINSIITWNWSDVNWHLLDVLRGIDPAELSMIIRREYPECCHPGEYQECLIPLKNIHRLTEIYDKHFDIVYSAAKANQKPGLKLDVEAVVQEARKLSIEEYGNV